MYSDLTEMSFVAVDTVDGQRLWQEPPPACLPAQEYRWYRQAHLSPCNEIPPGYNLCALHRRASIKVHEYPFRIDSSLTLFRRTRASGDSEFKSCNTPHIVILIHVQRIDQKTNEEEEKG